MLLPLSWLKQFINLKSSADEIATKLTLSGSEVEKIIDNSKQLSKIIVGEIKSVEPHPNADKLQLAFVDVGRAKDLKIVCGARNIKPGQKVPVALLGGSVPGMKIEPREIRGIKSQGMLCSQKELGIGDDHSGIFILPNELKVGTDVVSYLGLNDPIFEIDITSNRPDCFSIRGLSREVGALFGKKICNTTCADCKNCALSSLAESGTTTEKAIQVRVEDKKLCPKYCARAIQGINVKPSPMWLQNKLRQVGIRPINNVVDATNYVMIELGHPLHAFDANLLRSKQIIVRRARAGEKIVALDEISYTLNPNMLVIADSKKPVAIAGIMGGIGSGITQGTQNIILEAAVFDPVSIRKTSKSLDLRSESSSRFEKGVDFSAPEEAIDLAATMISNLAGGIVFKGIISVCSKAAKKKATIKLRISEVERILGIKISANKARSILKSLGFESSGKEVLSVYIPSWRVHDIKQQEDLIEEIGRMMDYNTFPKTIPSSKLSSPKPDPMQLLRRDFRRFLSGKGYSEILTYSFYDEASVERSGIAKSKHIFVTNPVNDEYPYLRASMLPWMLEKLSKNSSIISRDEFRLFEIGKVFQKGPIEDYQACIGIINSKSTDEDLYRALRGVIESFVQVKFSVKKHQGKYSCFYGKQNIADIFVYPKGTISGLRFRSSCAVALIDLSAFAKSQKGEKIKFAPIPFYPSSERDIGIIVSGMVKYEDIENAIAAFDPLIKNIKLFDVYHGLDEGSSFAVRLTFFSTDRTLESKEVDEIIENLKFYLSKKFKLSFR